MDKLRLVIVILIMHLCLFPSSLSAELTKSHFDIIRIAFLNGYANAIRSDMGTIKTLKKDRGKMRNFSQRAANSYLEKVCSLNEKKTKYIPKNKSTSTGSNSLSF